jgi:hypothetical protein
MKKKKLQLIFVSLFLMSTVAFSQQNDTTKKEFKPSGKLWGYVFGDFTYKAHTNSLNMSNTQYASMPKDNTSFEFRRIYLGYDYDISEKFATQLLLAYEGSTFTLDNNRSFYIKSANIRWKNIFHNSDLVFGQTATPTFATTSEPVWGYRALEKTIMDMRKIGGSNDVGISLQGKFNDRGDYGYNIMIGNGSGAAVETNKFKKFYGDVYAKFLDQKLLIDLGADNEMSQFKPYKKGKTTLKAFAAYQTKMFTLGVEAFQQVQQNNTTFTNASAQPDTANAVAAGISIFARGTLVKNKLNFALRYDNYNPDTKFKSSNTYKSSYTFFKESFFLVGLDFMPNKNVHIMPNLWYDGYSNKATAQNNLAKSSNDVAARLTVYYIFK